MTVPIEPTYDSADLADSLESSVLALLRVPPIRQALHDLLRIYGISAQSSEVIRNQSMQVQALAEVMTITLGRLIEHERRSTMHHAAVEKILDLLQRITDTRDGPAGTIARDARDALAQLQAQADIQPEPMESEALRARTLLRIAQSTARADLADAVATAQTLRQDAPPPPTATAQALRVRATEAATEAAESAAEAATQTLRAAAAETAATEAEAT